MHSKKREVAHGCAGYGAEDAKTQVRRVYNEGLPKPFIFLSQGPTPWVKGPTGLSHMIDKIENGTKKEMDGRPYIYYDGYWNKYYPRPADKDSLEIKKGLIEALTRRLFNHVEHGINIPGKRLDEARAAYESEQNPELKRVKGAMLAGALFNRAADIFTRLVDLQAQGVDVRTDNSLMRECGRCLMEALEFGKSVRHRSGQESIDELWGEPFKVFSIPVEAFFESRYIKISQTKRNIDQIAGAMVRAFELSPMFPGVRELIAVFATAAKRKCETLRTDQDIFEIWPAFVVAGEKLCNLEPQFPLVPTKSSFRLAEEGERLLHDGRHLVSYVCRARVPMPKSSEEYLERCEEYRRSWEELAAETRGI